jgi:hypothetical protein
MATFDERAVRRGATTASSNAGSFASHERSTPELAVGTPTLAEARHIMSTLQPGASVILTQDGRDYPCIVQRRDEGPGHPDSKSVTVGYGPGHWNTEVNAAGIAAGHHKIRVETNFERLQREAEITDAADPHYNSDLDIILPGTTATSRDVIRAGIDPNDEPSREAYLDTLRDAAANAGRVPVDEQTPAQLVDTLRRDLPAGATLLLEETDQGGRWLNPIGVRFADGSELRGADAEDLDVDWDELDWAASNIRGHEHEAFVETDRHGGLWELPPTTR